MKYVYFLKSNFFFRKFSEYYTIYNIVNANRKLEICYTNNDNFEYFNFNHFDF